LCTFNGERFLQEQLNSFLVQTHQNWHLWVSDDGSQDQTLDILADFSRNHPGRVRSIYSGPARNHAANFLSLLARQEIEADYFSFADQDDIWDPSKLSHALNSLGAYDDTKPLLYCGRTRIVDEANREIGLSPLFRKPPSFANALVQSIGGGNTMVINNRARSLLCVSSATVPVSHDWWAYIVVMGCGGNVVYDLQPTLRYRQHNENVIGVNSSWRGRLTRLIMLLNGRFRSWNDTNIRALSSLYPLLTPDSRHIFAEFSAARDASFMRRLIKLKGAGIHRQTLLGNLSLVAAAILKKI
jgi:glycosyltransferase involved in cell wall biosynthesis